MIKRAIAETVSANAHNLSRRAAFQMKDVIVSRVYVNVVVEAPVKAFRQVHIVTAQALHVNVHQL